MVVPTRRRLTSLHLLSVLSPVSQVDGVLQAGTVPGYPARTLRHQELQTEIRLHSAPLDPPMPTRRFLHPFAYK